MKIGLLGRILIAIALGVALGHVFTLPWVRIFVTFNSIFGQFLGFIIPLIILGLVTPAIADIGKERLRRAATAIRQTAAADGQPLPANWDGGFRVLKIGDDGEA